jgi:hypothetical protein
MLQDRFSSNPLTKKLLARAAQDRLNSKKAADYYHELNLLSSADS